MRYPLLHLCLMLGLAMNGCAAVSAPLDPPAQVAGAQIGGGATYWPVALEATEGQVEVYQPQPGATCSPRGRPCR